MHWIATSILRKVISSSCDTAACLTLAVLLVLAWFSPLPAQAQSGSPFAVQSGVGGGGVNIPETNLEPITVPPSTFSPPPSSLGQFDPYALQGSASGSTMFGGPTTYAPTSPPSVPPTLGPPTAFGAPAPVTAAPPVPSSGGLFGIFSTPASAPSHSQFGATVPAPPAFPNQVYPGVYDNPNVYGPAAGDLGVQGVAPFPGSAYPATSPNTLFPGGIFSGPIFQSPQFGLSQLLSGPRFRYGYVLGGNDPKDLQTHDFDFSFVCSRHRFMYSTQPLFVIPSFSLHLWDGPDSITGADLPSKAYSAFLDFGWTSDPNRMFSTEFGLRVGVFTDFDTFSSGSGENRRSVRILGRGQAHFRLTPFTTFKLGVSYLDRNSIKIIPVGGILYQPNPYNRYDIYFPQPKFSHYWRTVGTNDVWWYIGGDYGGGSWTIERADQTEDSVDINELRALLGIEWGSPEAFRVGRRTAFFEIGYVFNREIEYRLRPQDNIKPSDGILFRLGFGY